MAASGFPWRFVVTNRDTETVTLLDGRARQRAISAVLGAPWSISGEVPSDHPEINREYGGDDSDPFLSYNVRLLYAFRREGLVGTSNKVWVPRASGIIMAIEDVAGTEAPTSQFTAYDPWKYLYSRPLVREDATLPTNLLSFSGVDRAQVALQILQNSDAAHGNVYIDYGQTPYYAGTIEELDPITIDFEQGTTVGEAWAELAASGMDIVLDPVYDPSGRPGILSELSIYESVGSNRRNAIFAWDMPGRSVVGVSHLLDGTVMANKVQGYTQDGKLGGPVQVSAANVTKYGQYWAQEFVPSANAAWVELRALAELQLRKRGKESLVATPAPERSAVPLRDYFLGDSVPFYASRNLRQPLSNGIDQDSPLKRIYGIQIKPRDNGTETVDELLLTEPDA